MFSNFFHSVKEIANPSIQDGQKIQKNSNTSVILTENEELTEEGFVSIGRSSFIYSNNDQLYPPLPMEQTCSSHLPAGSMVDMPMPMPFGQSTSTYVGQSSPYPQNPQNSFGNFQSQPSIDMNEVLRNVPFVLHPDLRMRTIGYEMKPWDRILNLSRNLDFTEFNYDFHLEKSVIRDFEQQMDFKSGE